MGVTQSAEDNNSILSPEKLSYLLAERFAAKCLTPLELTHLKDCFFTHATDQAGIKHWDEKTLSDFLGIPDCSDSSAAATFDCPLDAGPVIFRMVSYLGAFPFQNTLAPSALTFEAMVKVVVLLTGRYGKILRRGQKDRIRLLFGSLADVGRKDTKPAVTRKTGSDTAMSAPENSHSLHSVVDKSVSGGYGDDVGDAGEDVGEDDLALAALELLDATEAFERDSHVDKAMYEARISKDTLYRLLMLLTVISPLKPLEPVRRYTSDLDAGHLRAAQKTADSILAAFISESEVNGVDYQQFVNVVSSSLPYLFDPITPLFEHLLFSENLDLSQKHSFADPVFEASEGMSAGPSLPTSVILPGGFRSSILNSSVLSHIYFFLSPVQPDVSFANSGFFLHPIFSTTAHGSSLTSFSHHVLTWESATLLILHGSAGSASGGREMITLGAYIPQPWKASSRLSAANSLPCLFQLSPKHLLLRGNPAASVHMPNTPVTYFSKDSGIAIGCKIPPLSRSYQAHPVPQGAGSLLIDTGLDTAKFYISSIGRNGVFLPPSSATFSTGSNATPSIETTIDIYNLEIWGLVPDRSSSVDETGQNAIELQRAKWDFEARDTERRRSLNFRAVGDSSVESARWLLESAGLIGSDRRGRSI